MVVANVIPSGSLLYFYYYEGAHNPIEIIKARPEESLREALFFALEVAHEHSNDICYEKGFRAAAEFLMSGEEPSAPVSDPVSSEDEEVVLLMKFQRQYEEELAALGKKRSTISHKTVLSQCAWMSTRPTTKRRQV